MARFVRKVPSRLRRKRRLAFFRQTFFLLVLALGIAFFVVMTLREPSLRIREIEISGEETIAEEEMLAVIRKELEGTYVRFIPKESILLYPSDQIEKNIRSAFSRLSAAAVSRKNLHAIVVAVAERAPAYLWCGAARESGTEECFFIDETGYLFGDAATLSGEMFTRFYGALQGEGDTPERKRFLPEAAFAELHLFVGKMRAPGLSPAQLVKKEDGDYELYLKEGGKVIFSLNNGAERIASNLESALLAEPLKGQMKSKRAALEYLDLRFGNKVFFKFR